jgi:hypothetical protein
MKSDRIAKRPQMEEEEWMAISCHRDTEYDERIQYRISDSVKFRIQEEINLRDDEIRRLKTDLAYLRGCLVCGPATSSAPSKSISDQYSSLKRELFDRQNALEIKIQQEKIEHKNLLRHLADVHNEKLDQLREKIHKAMLMKKPDADEGGQFDNFLESLKQSAANAETVSKKTIGKFDVDPDGRDPEILIIERDVERNNQKAAELKRQISNVRKISADYAPPSKANKHDSDIPRTGDDLHRSKEHKLVMDAHRAEMKNIERQLRGAISAGRDLDRNLRTLKANDTNGQSEGKRRHGGRLDVISREALIEKLGLMSDEEKKEELELMVGDNRVLKREIARLDFMIYGKAGKYQRWKNV